jgi:hypothetical protein
MLPPRTLLLTGTAPNPDGVGGIILADLCAFLPADRLAVAYVPEIPHGVQSEPELPEGVAVRRFPVEFRRRPVSRLGRAGKAVDAIGQALANRRQLARQIEACADWARGQGVEQVWAVLDSHVTVAMAAPLARKLGVPLRATVWDDVHHNNRYFGLDRLSARRHLGEFADSLRHASSLAVIGETMRDDYQRVYGVPSVVIRHGVAPATRVAAGDAAAQEQPLRIGFAGSVTAASAFEGLLAALDRRQWRLGGRPVVLRLFGHRFDLRSRVPRHVEVMGWRSVEDTIHLLGECDFNYLPQPFEADWKPFARLSFPSKLTTYLAAGRPLLLHAPGDASLPPFNDKYGFASACTSLDGAAVEQALDRLLEPARIADCIAGGQAALRAEFTRERFRDSFAEFLAVPAGALRP